MTEPTRRVVTGHDKNGKSVVLSDGPPPQHHPMQGAAVGADFFEMWSVPRAVPQLTSVEATEPNERAFTIMPVAGHLLRDHRHLSAHRTAASAPSCIGRRHSTMSW